MLVVEDEPDIRALVVFHLERAVTRLEVTARVRRLHWPLEDSAQAKGTAQEIREVFRRCPDGIEAHARRFLVDLLS